MQHFTIKTHQPGRLYLGEHFFILNKGMNSGKPLLEPCPNCFVMHFASHQKRENYYWIAYTLWQARFWHRHIVGTAIPFLRLLDFKKEFARKSDTLQKDYEQHLKNILALQTLQKKESQFQKNLHLIAEMRKVILFRYIKN